MKFPNKQQRDNIGLSIPFLIIAAIIVVTLLLTLVIPGNAIYAAPFANKVLAGIFAAGAVYYAIGWSKDKWFNSIENDKIWYFTNLGVFVALILLALLTLVVFHSGPIGVSTNPVI